MQVTLFRDMASEGWLSMARYADSLTEALQALGLNVRTFEVRRPWPGLRGSMNTLANYTWRLAVYPLAARSQKSDVNHILDHSYGHVVRSLDASRTVVTCHDIAPLVFDPPGRGLSQRIWRTSYAAMFDAARIIAISDFSRAEILGHSQYPPAQIQAIHYGVSPSFRGPAARAVVDGLRQRYGLQGRAVILHVGTCQPRKNVEVILRALPDLSAANAVFVQVGGRFTAAQQELVSQLGIGNRVFQAQAAFGGELRAWYQLADVFIFPSLYEGFGMPILEAMASGTPVVCANATSLPEVAGEAALLVDPHDASQIARATDEVLANAPLRESLAARGRARAGEFTWERTARLTMTVYEDLFLRRAT